MSIDLVFTILYNVSVKFFNEITKTNANSASFSFLENEPDIYSPLKSKTKMNTLTLQKQAIKLENFIKKASRALLEFEVAQAEWEAKKGLGKVYTSVDALMRDVKKGVRA